MRIAIWTSSLIVFFISFNVFSADVVSLLPQTSEARKKIEQLRSFIALYHQAEPRPKRALMLEFLKIFPDVPSQGQAYIRDIALNYLSLTPEQWMSDYWVSGRVEDYLEVVSPIYQASLILEAYAKKQGSSADPVFKDNLLKLSDRLGKLTDLPKELVHSVPSVAAKLKEVLILTLQDYTLAEDVFVTLENMTLFSEEHPAEPHVIAEMWVTLTALSNFQAAYLERARSLFKRIHAIAPSYESTAALLVYGVVNTDLIRRMIELHYNSFVLKYYEEVMENPQAGANPGIVYSKLTNQAPMPDIQLLALAERKLIKLAATDPKIKKLLLEIKTQINLDYSKNGDKGPDGLLYLHRDAYTQLADRYLTDLMSGQRKVSLSVAAQTKKLKDFQVLPFAARRDCNEVLDKSEE